MSVPLDRLYNFIRDVCDQDIIIYRFFPHGSKKVEDLKLLDENFVAKDQKPIMICHDQEPLCWKDYQDEQLGSRFRTRLANPSKLRHLLLLHSEKNSADLDQFVNDRMFPVYYWSHALIALDWFRYAKLDPVLCLPKDNGSKIFLVYQRAWSNTREYRLKFTELLIEHNLVNSCDVKFNPVDEDTNYRDHTFRNPNLTISRHDFETILPINYHDSHSSADYNNKDYTSTRIEVVLETLFDDTRLHLTEKSLRPIACKQPFMLAATPGSLAYIRGYGFKTFAPYINEEYDNETDPVKRLSMIVTEMQRIANLTVGEQQELFAKLDAIAQENQDLFFSQEWQDSIVNELSTNFNNALQSWQQLSQRRLISSTTL